MCSNGPRHEVAQILGSGCAIRSASCEVFLHLRVAITLYGDLGNGILDVPEVISRELDGCRVDVLPETVERGGAGDRNDPWLLRQEPGERDLRRRRALSAPDLFQKVDHGSVRAASLLREPRHSAATVIAAECRGVVDFAGEETPSERTVRNEADTQFLARW